MSTKLLGYIYAGFPTSASEELVDTMSLDEYLIDKIEATYLIKVKGESMVEEGILPGDLLLVERGRKPKPGDIVVAEVDGEYTMKCFKDIKAKELVRVEAVVRSVIRKYP
jgi:repressor LexA